MEKEPHDGTDPTGWPMAPPLDPDPELITTLEGGRKPTAEEVRKMAERAAKHS